MKFSIIIVILKLILVYFVASFRSSLVLEEVPQVVWKTSEIPVITGYTDLRINYIHANPCSSGTGASNQTEFNKEQWIVECTKSWTNHMFKISQICSGTRMKIVSEWKEESLEELRQYSDDIGDPYELVVDASDLLGTDWYTKLVESRRSVTIRETETELYRMGMSIANITGVENILSEHPFGVNLRFLGNLLTYKPGRRQWPKSHSDRYIQARSKNLTQAIWDFVYGRSHRLDTLFDIKKICLKNNITYCDSLKWRALGCKSTGEFKNHFQFRIFVPHLAPEFNLVQAAPFEFYTKDGPRWCRHTYIGPRTGITWRNGTCFQPINLNPGVQYVEHFRPLPDDCDPPIDDDSSLWRKGRCFRSDRNPNKIKFVELEPFRRFAMHCFGSTVRFRNETFDCPIKPFVVKEDENVWVNGGRMTFDSDDLLITQHRRSLSNKRIILNINQT